jgi:hypothetical protein
MNVHRDIRSIILFLELVAFHLHSGGSMKLDPDLKGAFEDGPLMTIISAWTPFDHSRVRTWRRFF